MGEEQRDIDAERDESQALAGQRSVAETELQATSADAVEVAETQIAAEPVVELQPTKVGTAASEASESPSAAGKPLSTLEGYAAVPTVQFGGGAAAPSAGNAPALEGTIEDTIEQQSPIEGLRRIAAEQFVAAAKPRLVLFDKADGKVHFVRSTCFEMGRRGKHLALNTQAHGWSANHALLKFDGLRFLLEDLGSKHGTYVDGVRLKPRVAVEIQPHTAIRMGNLKALFVAELDSRGRRFDPELQTQGLAWLRRSCDITDRAMADAEREAPLRGLTQVEVLVEKHWVDPEDWVEALQETRTLMVFRRALPLFLRGLPWSKLVCFSLALLLIMFLTNLLALRLLI